MPGVTLLSIGEAAARLGLRTSALRYYDQLGLVRALRRNGRRHYGPDELRRLATIQMLGRLGVGLDVAGAVLDAPRDAWRARARERIDALEAIIAEATAARLLLAHLLECPADHPVTQCPVMGRLLDRRLGGEDLEHLLLEEGRKAGAAQALPPPQHRPPSHHPRERARGA
jgi:DNA-binding transcriptional MerR regulator